MEKVGELKSPEYPSVLEKLQPFKQLRPMIGRHSDTSTCSQGVEVFTHGI
ncbi:uncharacterized protein LACBIDRAFT_305412 [Laccaria bicolor S238N-H82]|uniref:Predicted protein n=1 Tax=Laccaria bicolor (strain S238N-H82 / ATCC MYA-4686) TaxID=486041 RepID=B0CU60_LACBS|nr:uncharacterized protein LACBIDRAFT_305412 [Laccaria bicolor S238N-H82]EDR14036.1 predicted protein [Laccaria bicolor S238N-H82]|eukprot:XP_001874595.1 predicted protein [Laccaria bicolor S238N-H82]